MIVQCEKCGAPLTVTDGQRFVQCSYCGVTTQVRTTATIARAPTPAPYAPPPPVSYVPPPPYEAPSYAAHPPVARREAPKAGSGCVVAGVVTALALAGGLAGLITFQNGGSVFAIHVDPAAPATVATIPFGPGSPASVHLSGVAQGPILGSNVGTGCRGHFPVAPQFVLRLTTLQRIDVTTLGTNDLTMALREPSGVVHCDDDSGESTNPRLTLTLGPGAYPVWIGAYHANTPAAFSFVAEAEAQDSVPLGNGLAVNSAPTLGALTLAGPPGRATRAGTAGGRVDAHPLGTGCFGNVPPAPHLALVLRDARRVTLATTATDDLTMVLRGPDGVTVCDDDSGGSRQPRIERMLAPGVYQVWVGVYSGTARIPFSLDVSSVAAGSTATPAALSPSDEPTVSAVDLDRAGASVDLRGTATGALPASTAVPSCAGYVTAAPQFRLTTAVPRHVSLVTTSGSDLTLLLQGPGGELVCGTASRAAPTYEFNVSPGATTVWLGPSSRGARPSYRLTVYTRALAGGGK